jgi:hypothetical protein
MLILSSLQKPKESWKDTTLASGYGVKAVLARSLHYILSLQWLLSLKNGGWMWKSSPLRISSNQEVLE